jgi:hypothetical protein
LEPRHRLVDAIDQMPRGDLGERIAQIRLRVHAVELRRLHGISLTYNLGVAIFSGFTPAITTAMVNWTGAPISLAFYLMGASLISSIAVLTLNDRTGEALS